MASSPPDATTLIFQVHGRLLREAADRYDVHFQGLRAVSSHLRRQGHGSTALHRRLRIVDDAFALVRHISSASVASMVMQFCDEVDVSSASCSSDEEDIPKSFAPEHPGGTHAVQVPPLHQRPVEGHGSLAAQVPAPHGRSVEGLRASPECGVVPRDKQKMGNRWSSLATKLLKTTRKKNFAALLDSSESEDESDESVDMGNDALLRDGLLATFTEAFPELYADFRWPPDRSQGAG
eukprot:TRINITY_DN28073_c0_g1_i1.p1 TRINITY_DN28073_c0_g1~~TRINITY_DN28073_c0_g1_i1.p1  ORF type:complete len:236 (+),score=32.80 TRINITY_DN28073_c0_g1_i1:45-752(+)